MNKKAEQRKVLRKIWKAVRPLLVVILSVSIALAGVYAGVKILYNKYIMPMDSNDATPIEIVIPSGYGTSSIGKLLYESGLISNKAVFKIYVDFLGKSSNMKAGTYILSKNMDIPQMVDIICEGNPPRETMKITITEGTSVRDIGKQLVSLGLLDNPNEFYELCKTGSSFTEYSFITEIEDNPDEARKYKLEGYLFPSTYEVYVDSSPKFLINKMLLGFHTTFTSEYAARAAELGMTIDEVITLASLIEREAKTADFARVSAVFHNRLTDDMTLGSDAPLRYIFDENTLQFTSEQMESLSLYNTHVYKGLPLGPITNPGEDAIIAALYPDEEFLGVYYYFCLKDSETGELVFAKTLREHQKNVEKYRPNW